MDKLEAYRVIFLYGERNVTVDVVAEDEKEALETAKQKFCTKTSVDPVGRQINYKYIRIPFKNVLLSDLSIGEFMKIMDLKNKEKGE